MQKNVQINNSEEGSKNKVSAHVFYIADMKIVDIFIILE